jgi:LacI family transcriptional regulator
VSRALAGQDGVSEETRERVRKAAREVGYVANQLARSLKGNDSRTIGILAAHTANQYYATLVGAINAELGAVGFQSILADTAGESGREANFVGALLEQRVAAIVVTYSISQDNLKLLSDWRIPIVFVDCVAPDGFTRYPSVICDNEAAGHDVGDHFHQHGYRHWAFLGYPPLWSSRLPRESGFAGCARGHGAHLDVVECGNDSGSAYEAMTAYLSGPSDARARALYCGNTPLLQGALRALAERGLRVPDDMAIVAFDEFEWASLLRPPVTVVDQHTTTVGRRAASLLLSVIKDGGENPLPGKTLVRPELIVRRSCGCRPA